MIPIQLSALTTGAAIPALPAVVAPAFKQRIFRESNFIEMKVQKVQGDHVIASHDDETHPYAIGHLPDKLQRLLVPPAEVSAQLAGEAKRTILGLVSDKAIEDLRDEDPMVCPIAVSVIRLYASDPQRSLREYAGHAVMLGDITGQEIGRDGELIIYHGNAGKLMIEISKHGWVLEGDSLKIPYLLPATICSAAAGRPLDQLIDHEMLNGNGGRVTHAEHDNQGTTIAFTTTPIRLKSLPEMQG